MMNDENHPTLENEDRDMQVGLLRAFAKLEDQKLDQLKPVQTTVENEDQDLLTGLLRILAKYEKRKFLVRVRRRASRPNH